LGDPQCAWVGDESTAAWRASSSKLPGEATWARPALADHRREMSAWRRRCEIAWPARLPDPALHGAQAPQMTAEGAGRQRQEVARDYRRVVVCGRPRPWCSSGVRAFVKKWRLQCRPWPEFRGGRRRAVHFVRFPRSPVESADDGPRVGNGSTRNSGDGPRRKRACPARTPSSCCCSGCCAPVHQDAEN